MTTPAIPATAYAELLAEVESYRREAAQQVDDHHKAEFGQFLTPTPVASFMASMLTSQSPVISLLDAGAGVGTLFATCIAKLCQRETPPTCIQVTAYEIDTRLQRYLDRTIQLCAEVCRMMGITFTGIVHDDFIRRVVEQYTAIDHQRPTPPTYNSIILNPPYRKIQSRSTTRKLLQQVGIEANNLYIGFLAISMQLLKTEGELIAITPRSFCNGPYFKAFRETFIQTMQLQQLHVFDSRQEVFRDDDVLQENVILHAMKSERKPEQVRITSSYGLADTAVTRDVPYSQVVHPQDPESFIRIVSDAAGQQVAERMALLHTSLHKLGLQVSTGPLVDFRAKENLRKHSEEETAALIYPAHFNGGFVVWPKADIEEPNALTITERTRKQLVPNEHYVLVKRVSFKEDRKRIVASVYDAGHIATTHVAFENHLNFFHKKKRGFDLTLAKGLAAFLNSTLVDTYFRQFNGHTQVNVTDLRNIHYPTLEQLHTLGGKFMDRFPDQVTLDIWIDELSTQISV